MDNVILTKSIKKVKISDIGSKLSENAIVYLRFLSKHGRMEVCK